MSDLPRHAAGHPRKKLLYLYVVIPAEAGIQKNKKLDSLADTSRRLGQAGSSPE
jgi:hypothetical protein